MSLSLLHALATLGAKIPGHILAVGTAVLKAVSDGSVSAEEAKDLAVKASREAGDLKVVVRGQDCVTPEVQDLLASAVGLFVRNVVTALV